MGRGSPGHRPPKPHARWVVAGAAVALLCNPADGVSMRAQFAPVLEHNGVPIAPQAAAPAMAAPPALMAPPPPAMAMLAAPSGMAPPSIMTVEQEKSAFPVMNAQAAAPASQSWAPPPPPPGAEIVGGGADGSMMDMSMPQTDMGGQPMGPPHGGAGGAGGGGGGGGNGQIYEMEGPDDAGADMGGQPGGQMTDMGGQPVGGGPPAGPPGAMAETHSHKKAHEHKKAKAQHHKKHAAKKQSTKKGPSTVTSALAKLKDLHHPETSALSTQLASIMARLAALKDKQAATDGAAAAAAATPAAAAAATPAAAAAATPPGRAKKGATAAAPSASPVALVQGAARSSLEGLVAQAVTKQNTAVILKIKDFVKREHAKQLELIQKEVTEATTKITEATTKNLRAVESTIAKEVYEHIREKRDLPAEGQAAEPKGEPKGDELLVVKSRVHSLESLMTKLKGIERAREQRQHLSNPLAPAAPLNDDTYAAGGYDHPEGNAGSGALGGSGGYDSSFDELADKVKDESAGDTTLLERRGQQVTQHTTPIRRDAQEMGATLSNKAAKVQDLMSQIGSLLGNLGNVFTPGQADNLGYHTAATSQQS